MNRITKLLLIFGMCFSLLAGFNGAGNAGFITLSNVSSDETPASVLDAGFHFDVAGSNLLLRIFNDTAAPYAFYINEIFFNSSSKVESLSLLSTDPSSTPGWTYEANQAANGFGVFKHTTYAPRRPINDIKPGDNMLLTFAITGSSVTQSDFLGQWSTNPPGNISALAAAKFVRGPNDDSAFGAAVPIPPAILLLGSGLCLFAAVRKRIHGAGD
jgi:hypothetical protein